MKYDPRYYARCDVCGLYKSRAYDFATKCYEIRGIPTGICRQCHKANVVDDYEDEIEYFAATSTPLKKSKPPKVTPKPLDQISLFPGVKNDY